MLSVSPYFCVVVRKVDLPSQGHEWDVKEEYRLPFMHWETVS